MVEAARFLFAQLAMFWIYSMPSALLAFLTLLTVLLLANAGLWCIRRYLAPRLGFSRDTNEAVSSFSLGITALYSVTIGLIAVASWQNYSASAGLVSREASTIGVLYRDVGGYPEPLRTDLRHDLRTYTTFLVEQVWPAQQRGRLLDEPTAMLTAMHQRLLSFDASRGSLGIVHAEVMRKFDDLVDLRRLRVDRVDDGLPFVLWIVVGLGGWVTVVIRGFLAVPSEKAHLVLTSLLALMVGLLVYLILALDRPFRGTMSVSADAYALIIERVMNPLDHS